MADLYEIVLVPDPVLKETAQPVESLTPDIKTQIARMWETMYNAPGIGLAANQVGLLNRVFVMDCTPRAAGEEDDLAPAPKTARNPLALINPEIVWRSEETSLMEEGCLSIPGQYAEVERPASIRVAYIDEHGKEQERACSGVESHCVQHELDHLNGVLFVDYLSKLKRNMLLKKLEKWKKDVL